MKGYVSCLCLSTVLTINLFVKYFAPSTRETFTSIQSKMNPIQIGESGRTSKVVLRNGTVKVAIISNTPIPTPVKSSLLSVNE